MVNKELGEATKSAANEFQKEAIQNYMESFKTGKIDAHKVSGRGPEETGNLAA